MNRGYTLIELIVVFSIIGILTGIGVVTYRDFSRKQTVKGAALTLKNNLRIAQNKALAGEKDCAVNACGGTVAGCGNDSSEKALDRWEFGCNELYNVEYYIYGFCGGSGGRTFGSKTYTLPPNVSITSGCGGSPPSIRFKALGQGVEGPRTICLSGFGLTYKLSVTVSGEIKDEGFVACP